MTNYYATIRGTIATPSLKEIFVHGLAISSSADASTVANSLSTLWQAALNTGVGAFPLKNAFPLAVAYNEVTCAPIINLEPPDPRLAAATHVLFTPIAGGAGTTMLPSQVALAVSYKAGLRPNGVPQKGRFYLPTPSSTMLDAATGLLTATNAGKIRDDIADFWAQLRAAGHIPCMWSKRYGTMTPWDSIRVGQTFDTMRTRRNELPEVYTQYVTVP